MALWFETALIGEQWAQRVRLTVEGGLVAAIETGAAPQPGDQRGAIAIPGLNNVHSHAFQRGMAGLTEFRGSRPDDDFWSWRELMYRFLGAMDPDDVEAVSALAFVEMLEAGFTRVGEFHYLHHGPDGAAYGDRGEMAGRIVAAAKTSGIGLTLLPVYYAQGDFGGAPPTPGQRRFLNDVEGFIDLVERSGELIGGLPDAVLGVAPHSLRAVTPEDLRAVVAAAPASGPVHIHAAEQVKEVEGCLAWSGRRPAQWLLDEIGLDGRWCLIHATHLDARETAELAASGAVAGLCPVTEANLGDGVFPAIGYMAAGGRFGIGTDSNVLIDAAQELRLIEYAQRLTRRARNLLGGGRSTGASLFLGAMSGGAQALGQTTGAIAVGGAADIVSLDAGHPSLMGRAGDLILDSFVFGGAGLVKDVWRRGERVVADGRHVAREAVLAPYRKTLARLLA